MGVSTRWARWLPIPIAASMALAGWAVLGSIGSSSAESGGLELRVDLVETVAAHQDDVDAAFQMPQSMTPGLQTEDQTRVHIEVVLHNPTDEAKASEVDDFHLLSASGDRWHLNDDVVVPPTLKAGFSAGADLFFDIPAGQEEDDLLLEWSNDGRTVEIPVDPGRAHDHGGTSADVPEAPAPSDGQGQAEPPAASDGDTLDSDKVDELEEQFGLDHSHEPGTPPHSHDEDSG